MKLTHEQIDALEAGREMDMLVEEWVMKGKRNAAKFYSTDIAAAWQVVEKMIDPPEYFKLDFDYMGWYCQFGGIGTIECKTAPLAICRAALKAVIDAD